MNAAENGAATIPCPVCHTANVSVARFCLTCGAPLQPRVPPEPLIGPGPLPPASPPPLPPRAPTFAPSGYLGGAGGAGSGQTLMNVDIASAFQSALQAIQSVGGTIQAQQAPSLIRFEISKRSFATTLGARIPFDCEMILSPAGPRQTSIRLSAKISSSGSTTLMGVCAGLAVLFWWTAISVKAPLWGVIGTAGAAGSYWLVSGKGPGEMVQRVMNALSAPPMSALGTTAVFPTASVSPQSSFVAPPTLPTLVQSSGAIGSTSTTAGTVFEQLRQLGELRDAGIITGDEFEAKKADLLKRV